MTPAEIFDQLLAQEYAPWLSLSDPALHKLLGTTPGGLRKALSRGTCTLRITPNAGGRQGVLLADVAAYLTAHERGPDPSLQNLPAR